MIKIMEDIEKCLNISKKIIIKCEFELSFCVGIYLVIDVFVWNVFWSSYRLICFVLICLFFYVFDNLMSK